MSHGTVGVASLRALFAHYGHEYSLQAFTGNGGCQWIIPGIKTTTNPLIYNWEVNCPLAEWPIVSTRNS